MNKNIIYVLIAVALTLFFTRLQTKNYTPRYTSNSFIEWLDNKLKSGSVVKSLTVTEVIEGNIQNLGYVKGRIGGLQYYYTGSPGYYTYDSYITLVIDKKVVPIYFSTERTRKMKVFRNGEPIPFASIQSGEYIRLTEILDITKDNVNDGNLKEIRIDISPKLATP